MFFREVQYFRQPWLYLLLAIVILVNLWGVVQQLVLGIPWGNNPASDELLVMIFLASGVMFPLFLLSTHLEVEVEASGISYRFFPFHLKKRTIAWSDITAHSVIVYRPLRDFGGWGIRFGALGKAYTVSGSSGVLVELKNGGRLVFGSRKATELNEAISLRKTLERTS